MRQMTNEEIYSYLLEHAEQKLQKFNSTLV